MSNQETRPQERGLFEREETQVFRVEVTQEGIRLHYKETDPSGKALSDELPTTEEGVEVYNCFLSFLEGLQAGFEKKSLECCSGYPRETYSIKFGKN